MSNFLQIIPLHQAFCDYSLTFKGNTKATIRWLKQSVNELTKSQQITELPQATRNSIEEWIIRGKLEKKWSARTIRGHLRALSLFFDWCVKREYMPKNPVADIDRPKIPSTIPQHLTKEQALKLLEWAQNFRYDYRFERTRATAIIGLFIFTGIRYKELRELKLSDIDLTQRTLFVHGGKGDKDRMVPLHHSLISILEAYLKDRDRLKKSCPYFFVSLRGDAEMGMLVVKRLVERLRKKSGIYFYPHLLRHTFATLMLEGGCDLFTLSKMLGHSDIKTTTIYLSATTAHMQEQIIKHPLGFNG